MPTYDYECGSCGETFEVFHSISESPKRKCPGCGKPKLTRLIGAGSGFIFKGSGFYITDYRSEDYKAKAKADSDGPSGKSESSEKATDSGKSAGSSSSSKSRESTPKPAKSAKTE